MKDYKHAWNAGILLARRLNRDVGLEKPGYDGNYRIFALPDPKNRSGHELRCQVIRPDEPLLFAE